MRTRFVPPNATYWFGTDEYGRDVLSRLLMGTRLSLTMGVSATLVSLAVGIPMGLAAGYFRGWIDEALMRLADVLMAVPPIMLGLLVLAVTPPALWIPGTKKLFRNSESEPLMLFQFVSSDTGASATAAANSVHKAALPTPSSRIFPYPDCFRNASAVRISCARQASSVWLNARKCFTERSRAAMALPVWNASIVNTDSRLRIIS